MSEELRMDDVMAHRFQLVEEVAIIQGRHKAELEPLQEEISLCEKVLHEHMVAQGLQQLKTDAGMAFFQTGDSVTVEDFDAFIEYVVETGAVHLLNKAANKTAVKEFIEANKTPPIGVKYDSFRKLAWRRGKG